MQAPESLLALTFGEGGADALRERIEDRLTVPYEELTVTTFQGLCARLLRDEALEAGIDPFTTPVAAADRLAMLLERIDDLPLRHHDLRGNPSATLGAIVRRIDSLKDELISAADYAAWAAGLPEDATGAREREFAALFTAHDGLLNEAGALDFGDLVLQSFRLLRERPLVRARVAARFAPRARRRAAGRELRPGPAAAAARGRARRDHARSPTTTRRSTASAARRPRTCATSAPSGRTRP